MIPEYEINNDTLAIVPISESSCEIIEIDQSFIVNKKATDIIDDSCKFFGSSYLGRHEGTKNLIGVSYKSPIIIEESKGIIFFPTLSPRQPGCYWLAFHNIKNCEKIGSITKIIFKNKKEIIVNNSYYTIKNQLFKSTMLESVLRKRSNYFIK